MVKNNYTSVVDYINKSDKKEIILGGYVDTIYDIAILNRIGELYSDDISEVAYEGYCVLSDPELLNLLFRMYTMVYGDDKALSHRIFNGLGHNSYDDIEAEISEIYDEICDPDKKVALSDVMNSIIECSKIREVVRKKENDFNETYGGMEEEYNDEDDEDNEYVNTEEYEEEHIVDGEEYEESSEGDKREIGTAKWDSTATLAVKRVIDSYSRLFKSGYEMEMPVGALCRDGYVELNEDYTATTVQDDILAGVWRFIVNSIRGSVMQSEANMNINYKNIQAGYNYYQYYQARNVFGVIKDGDDYIKHSKYEDFEKSMRNKVRGVIEDALKNGINDEIIINTLTNCVVVTYFVPDIALKLKISIEGFRASQRDFELAIQNRYICKGIGKIFRFTQNSGVCEIDIIFDSKKYSELPIFAYEAIEMMLRRGENVKWNNLILGKCPDGNTYTINLTDNTKFSLGIVATSRAGKGVMTLNILANAYGSGYSVMYIDSKPDMADTLWELERKYHTKTFTYDSQKVRPGYRPDYRKIPNDLVEYGNSSKKDIGGLITYMRAIQIMCIAALMRSHTGEFRMTGLGGDRVVCVVDELQKIAAQMTDVMNSVKDNMDRLKKDKKEDGEEYAYCIALKNFISSVCASITKGLKADFGVAGMNILWLFQDIREENWKNDKSLSGAMTLYSSIIGAPGMTKILGAGTTNAKVGLYSVASNKEIAEYINTEQRNFALTTSRSPSDMSEVKVFKPYLVLNNGDKNGEYVKKLIDSCPDVKQKITDENGNVDNRVGLDGVISMLLDNEQSIGDVLGKGYKTAEEILKTIGLLDKYNGNVDNFMYDYSIESLISVNKLISNALEDKYGGNVNGGATGSEYGDFDAFSGAAKSIYDGGSGEYEEAEYFGGNYGELEDSEDGWSDPNANSGKYYGTSGEYHDVPATEINTIDSTSVGDFFEKYVEQRCDMPNTAGQFTKELFSRILDSIEDAGVIREVVTRIHLIDGSIKINNRMVNLNGVLGGINNVRLIDIIDFKKMFNRFYKLRELHITIDMAEAMVMELGSVSKVFKLEKNLMKIYIVNNTGIEVIERGNTGSFMNKEHKNRMDLTCAFASNSGDMYKKSTSMPQYNMWMFKTAKRAIKYAGNNVFVSDKPKKLIRSSMATIASAALFSVGGVAFVTWKAIKTILDIVGEKQSG